MPLKPGTRVGEYLLGDLLARGSFGAVYRGLHAERRTPAAIKLLHDHLTSRADVVIRFEREIDVIERLQHPNVARILEHGRDEHGSPFLILELLEGVTLAKHMRDHGRASPMEALAILEPIASALEAAHALGVIHRDVKASNVFLADPDARVVLLDFGVAKLLDVPGPALTGSREMVGTLACMSPEQISNLPVDARADIYGLGVLAYQLLVGHLPFQSKFSAVMCELHLHASPPAPSARAPLSHLFDDVLLRALSKAPEDRHRTVGAFIESLRAAVMASRRPGSRPQISRRALVVYGEAQVDDTDGDGGVELESLLPSIAAELTAVGLTVIVETGASILLSMDLPEEADEAQETRRRVTDAALTAFRRVEGGLQGDARVRLRLCLHAGEVTTTHLGEHVTGELFDVSSWVPDEADGGVFASAEAIEGLEITPQASAGSAAARLRISGSQGR